MLRSAKRQLDLFQGEETPAADTAGTAAYRERQRARAESSGPIDPYIGWEHNGCGCDLQGCPKCCYMAWSDLAEIHGVKHIDATQTEEPPCTNAQ